MASSCRLLRRLGINQRRRKDPRNLKRIRSQSSFLGTGKPRRSLLSRNFYGGNSFLKNGWVWITVSCLCFRSSIAASIPPASKPETHVVNARVNESLSISCGEQARSDFRWNYFLSGKGPERLYSSLNTKNCTNALMTCLPNGTFIFQSVQESDMGEYICIVYQTTETHSIQFGYSLIVQNSTVNHSEVEVMPGSIPGSRHHGVVIAVGVFVGLVAVGAVAVFIYCFVSKRRKQKHLKEQTDSALVENGESRVTGATNSSNTPMLNGHKSQ